VLSAANLPSQAASPTRAVGGGALAAPAERYGGGGGGGGGYFGEPAEAARRTTRRRSTTMTTLRLQTDETHTDEEERLGRRTDETGLLSGDAAIVATASTSNDEPAPVRCRTRWTACSLQAHGSCAMGPSRCHEPMTHGCVQSTDRGFVVGVMIPLPAVGRWFVTQETALPATHHADAPGSGHPCSTRPRSDPSHSTEDLRPFGVR
jgi:hypothetical protein